MKYITIIQTRTASSRLPAKCFLPLANMPLVTLCFKRAVTSFADTWVAITEDSTDDLLADYLKKMNIPYFRGHSDNVLDRYKKLCIKLNLNPDVTVIRLTGDNPIVDKTFLEKMKIIWENNNLDYLSGLPLNHNDNGWPKGLSAEFFRVRNLYDINTEDADKYTKEHVTPSIKKNSKNTDSMESFEKLDFHFKRSYSIDTLEEYIYLASLFEKVDWDESYIKVLDYEKKQLI